MPQNFLIPDTPYVIFDRKSQKLTPKSVFALFYVSFCLFYVAFFHKIVDNIMCQKCATKLFGPRHPICHFWPEKSKIDPKISFHSVLCLGVPYITILCEKCLTLKWNDDTFSTIKCLMWCSYWLVLAAKNIFLMHFNYTIRLYF